MNEAPSEALMQEVKQAPDLIQSTVYEVENLSKEQAFGLVDELTDASDFNNFKLGGVLSVIYNHSGWYGEQYPSFKEMLVNKYPMVKYRKAMYLIDIYSKLVAAEISWAQVGHLGWTKLKELAQILTKDNVDALVKMAEGMTVLQLQEYIKGLTTAKPTMGGETEEVTETKQLTTITFKVYEDQKETIRDALKKAKVEAGTEYDNVAIENICMGYLSGGAAVKTVQVTEPVNLADELKKVGYEEALMLIGSLWPEIEISVRVP